jgi:hypothetical protein
VDGGRSDWSDDRIQENFAPLRALPAEVARQAVRNDEQDKSLQRHDHELEELGKDMHEGDRRLHERVDGEVDNRVTADSTIETKVSNVRAELLTALSDRDREYRRNIILAVGPLLIVILLIAAKVLFGIDLPKL